MSAFLRRGYLTGGDGTFDPSVAEHYQRTGYGHDVDYALTPAGDAFLADFGVQLPPRRRVIRYCVDWSEQRHHLAGAFGRGLRDRLVELDWIRRADGNCAIRITKTSRGGLAETFDVEV